MDAPNPPRPSVPVGSEPQHHAGAVARLARAALLILALLALSLPAAPAAQAARVHPSLVALAAAQPDATVSVIVQEAGAPAAARAQVAALGGEQTYDFPMLRAFGATMSARSAEALGSTPDVRWVALDAPIVSTSTAAPCGECIDVAGLATTYAQSIGADQLWNTPAEPLQGQGVTVAIIDSGVNAELADFARTPAGGGSRIVQSRTFAWGSVSSGGWDSWGHGTHVAGIIGGNGASSGGKQLGIAPKVNLLIIKVGDGKGSASVSDVLAGLQWVYANRAAYNIRVANLSLTSTVAESYHTSPLNAAVELLWFNGITVVVAGGNTGQSSSGVGYAPSNDPFVISVGAADERGTPDPSDDTLASFTARGQTADGFAKPDLIAPGVNLISPVSSKNAVLPKQYSTRLVTGWGSAPFMRLSGTSMSSAVTAGAVALLLQHEPGLTPDQVKARLTASGRAFSSPGWSGPYLDIRAAVNATTTTYANDGVIVSQLLWTNGQPVSWSATNWSATNWSATNWSATNWSATNWSATNWSSISWGE